MNPIQTAAIVGLIFSFPSLILSFKRLRGDKDVLSVILALIASIVTATFISAFFHAEDFIAFMANSVNLPQRFNPRLVGISLAIAGLLLDVTMYVCVKKITNANLWKSIICLLLTFMGVNFLAGIGGSMITSCSFDQCFFGSCCASMGVAGLAWGFTYKEICVIGNLYMQAGIFLFTAAYIVWAACQRYRNRKSKFNLSLAISSSVYLLATIIGCCWVGYHYTLPLEASYDKCYHELVNLTHTYGLSYNNVNYLIFIVFYLAIVIVNLLLAGFLQPNAAEFKTKTDNLILQSIE